MSSRASADRPAARLSSVRGPQSDSVMTMMKDSILDSAASGDRLDEEQVLALAGFEDTGALMAAARCRRDRRSGDVVTFSPKIFIPLTELCRDVCRYCTFAKTPGNVRAPYLSVDEAIDVARRGAEAGCTEALFTLGDQPERRYRAAREALARMGFESTIDYLVHAARRVHEETGLLPHVNPGIMQREEIARLREVSVSAGIMLESTSRRLCEKGGPHYGSPDKDPEVRLATLERAGELAVPFTTGILIGIGETRRERVESLLAIRDVHERHGHIQEVIVQNFRAKPARRCGGPEPYARGSHSVDHRDGAAVLAGHERPGAAEPAPGGLVRLVEAGSTLGRVSPVTPTIGPGRRRAAPAELERGHRVGGQGARARLALQSASVPTPERGRSPGLRSAVLGQADGQGLGRDWPLASGEAEQASEDAPCGGSRRPLARVGSPCPVRRLPFAGSVLDSRARKGALDESRSGLFERAAAGRARSAKRPIGCAASATATW